MDLSDGDNPRRWIPLNDGKPILTSTIGTTGVRDPHIIRNPQTGTWYVIATDLRVFGGVNAAGSSGLVMPVRISSFGNPMTWYIGASRVCLTFHASRTVRILSWVWRGPANACGFPIIIRKVTRVVAERSSCTGPARFSTMMILIILMMACAAPCCGSHH